MHRLICCLLAVMLCGGSGCGTIIHGREQKISMSSHPSGARVLYDGGGRGETPCLVSISRRRSALLVLQKDGFKEKEVHIKVGISMWALLGNAVLGGIPGWIIDAAAGSFGAFYEDSYRVDLDPVETTQG